MRPTIKVYQYRQLDPDTGRIIISFWKMSADAIEALGAEAIADTEQEVSEAALDDHGRFTPYAH